jgi:PII-like signaling protein
MRAPVKMLVIYVDETDVWGQTHTPLYEALVRRIRQLGMAGATAQAGIMGFGSHHKVHHARLFGISDDRPVVVTVVDEEEKIRGILPEIQSMVREGMIVLLDVEFIA